jgi:glutamate/tyrosine decarboxylase-like PLP-dependent enzyme
MPSRLRRRLSHEYASLQKAAMQLGVGADAVVPVETDANSRMKPASLEQTVQ